MQFNDGRVVSNLIVQALRGDEITIYGDGNQTRSFCYVSDLVDGLIRLLFTEPNVTGPINLGNPREDTIRTLAEKIITLTNSRSKIVSLPLPLDDPRQRKPDISKAFGLYGWRPEIELEQGIAQTAAYFKSKLKL
jgi:UDP-glucuronate decarboxylase